MTFRKTQLSESEENRRKFERELEFVQLLTNPEYLRWLYEKGFFASSDFINFLKYLEYWKRPEYSRVLLYPQCLIILDILNNNSEILKDEEFYASLNTQQYFAWLHRGKRM